MQFTGLRPARAPPSARQHNRCQQACACAKPNKSNPSSAPVNSSRRSSSSEQKEPGLGLKVVWTAAEQFGNLVGFSKQQPSSRTSVEGLTQISREDAIRLIKADYEADYFISGTGEMQAYAEDCYFADPFAGFKGTERFVKNVRNLGGMLDDVKIDVFDWSEDEDSVRARWRFSSVLNVPWRPILAAGGSTTHKFDPDTGLVVQHIEAWDTEPLPVLKRLLKPSRKRPENRWEVFMLSLSQGDSAGMLLAISDKSLVISASLVAVIVASTLIFGSEWQGTGIKLSETFFISIFAASAIAEISKLGRGLG